VSKSVNLFIRELNPVAKTVAMKKNQKNKQTSDYRRFAKNPSFENFLKLKEVKSRLKHIYTEEFFSYLEMEFLEVGSSFLGPFLVPPKLKIQISLDKRVLVLSNFKEFQKSKDPQYLGRAISIFPHLLNEKSIKLKIESYIFDNTIKKNNSKKSDLNLLCKGLEYKYKEDDSYFSNDFIKYFFETTHKILSYLFKEHKPKTIEDRATVIKKLSIDKKLLFFDKWCKKWAEGKEPKRIALRIVQTFEAYNRDDRSFIQDLKKRFNPPNRLSLNKLSEIVKK